MSLLPAAALQEFQHDMNGRPEVKVLRHTGECRAVMCLVATAFACLAGSLNAANVSFEGRFIKVDGQPFLMKGVCYQPTPIGQTATQPPFGDYFTLNHRSLYERDLPRMRAMGANSLRIYNWDRNADHRHFLDLAWNQGQQPVYVLINAYIDPNTSWSNAGVINQLKSSWRQLAANAAPHPAVIGFLIGNELNLLNPTSQSLWNALNAIAGEIRAVAPHHIISTPLADVNLIASTRDFDSVVTNFNCWAWQVFRGRTFGNLLSDYPVVSRKPLLISEFGMDAYDQRVNAEYTNSAALTAEYLKSLWLEIERRTNVVSGGAVFEWIDEWWKDQRQGTSTSRQDAGGWSTAAFPDGIANEEWWGIHRIIAGGANRIEPRAAYSMFQQLWHAPTPRLNDVAFARPTGFTATLEGPAGSSFVVEASKDLAAWVPVQTNTIPFLFRDPNAFGAGWRYYRAVGVP